MTSADQQTSGKWLDDVDPRAPLVDAARVALDRCLSELLRRLETVTANPDDAERVRRLRVALRRTAVALDVFEACIPVGNAKVERLRRRMARARRAAGRLRDCDVHIELAHASVSAGVDPGDPAMRINVDSLQALRERRRRRFLRTLGEEGPRIERRIRRMMESLKTAPGAGEDGPTLLDAARASLLTLLREAGKAAAADLDQPENLHELRIACKRVRYALELFVACVPAEVKDRLYPGLIAIQDTIGQSRDVYTFLKRIESVMEDVPLAEGDAASVSLPRIIEHFQQMYESRRQTALEHLRTEGLGILESLDAAIGGSLGKPQAAPPIAGSAEGAKRLVATRTWMRPGEDGPVRLAVIDIGTNSIRLEVVEAFRDRTYRVLDDEKETVRLGAGIHRTGVLADDAMDRAVEAIARMVRIAEGFNVHPDGLRAIATYAVRAAANGATFVERVRIAIGLDVRVLSAEEEAKLAFVSADHAFNLSNVVSAVIDIGGGSTEIVVSAAGVAEQVYGTPLGAMMLTEQFGGPAASSVENFRQMRRHIDTVLRRAGGSPPAAPQIVIGTGGTFGVLASMLSANGGGGGPQLWDRRAGFEATRSGVKHILEQVRRIPPARRASFPGLPADRADIIVAGLTIVDRTLKHLGANAVRVHDRGIREGVILAMIAEVFPDGLPTPDALGAVRRFAQKCNYERPHCEHVTRMALEIHQQLAEQLTAISGPEPWMTPDARRILEAAGVLHDIGYLVNYAAHHKHSYHLIVHSDLADTAVFTRREVELIANIARYHRRAEPSRSHRPYRALSPADRALVSRLAAILRIADGFDRRHAQTVQGVDVLVDGTHIILTARTTEDAQTERWGAMEKAPLLERKFGRKVLIRVSTA